MAHTDKTDPWIVKARWYPREVHDHRDHDCNLAWENGWRGDCHYEGQWYRRIFRCCCSLCGYQSRSKDLRRADKIAIREGLRDYYEDRT